jgi:sulfate transport system ATP-binding protein
MSVRVVDVKKGWRADGPPAVRGVSFSAPRQAITALIGPSGSGKTTLLRMIAGLEAPDEGSVFIDDVDVTAVAPQRRDVGLVFQGYALFPHLSVEDNVGFGLAVRQRPRAEIAERVSRMLQLVQLEHLRRRRPAELSGGQRQRVAFARALAIAPKVLLLDEPFGALDARVRAELREWLVRLHEETKTTTLLVTHDQDEALEVSAHVVVLLDGQVAQAGAPQEVYERPATPATATFLGASPLQAAGRGAGAVSFVRPENVKLTRAAVDVADARLGAIERVRAVGPRVKIVLQLLQTQERVDVEVARDEFDALAVNVGDVVEFDVRGARVFLGDFVI